MATFGQNDNSRDAVTVENLNYTGIVNVENNTDIDSLEAEMSDLESVLPSQIASDIDEHFFTKFSTKETFRTAVQRASAICRSDSTKYRQLGAENVIHSPSLQSLQSPTSSIATLAASRDSLAVRGSRGYTPRDLRQSALKKKALLKLTLELDTMSPKTTSKVNRVLLWIVSLSKIRSYFGRAAASYFSLVRFLFILNVAMSAVIFFCLVLPFLVASDAPNPVISTVTECQQKLKHLDWVLCNETALDLSSRCSREFRAAVEQANDDATWIIATTNVLRGQGPLTFSPLYYSYYTEALYTGDSVFPGGLLYFIVLALVYMMTFFALLLFSYKSVVDNESYKSEDFHYHFSSVVLGGWDHSTRTKFSCDMRQAAIRRFLKIELHRVLRRVATAYLERFAFIKKLALRCFLMILSGAVIVSSVIVILITSSCAQKELDEAGDGSDSWFSSFWADFLPPIVVVVLNTFQPDVFVLIAKFENYSPETDIKLILFRLIFSRFCTLVTYMVPLLGFQLKDICPVKTSPSKIHGITNLTDFSCAAIKLEHTMGQKSYCWEANIGEQLYKIVIIDLLMSTLLLTFGYSFLRRIAVEKIANMHPKLLIIKKLGRREFELPVEIVNLFYIQTICWMGLYFMPLLSVFVFCTRFILFYTKKWDLFENTYLTWRVRAADFVLSFYLAYLCACFIVAIAFTGYAASIKIPSPGCGPFAMANNSSALETVFDEIKAISPSSGRAADKVGHPLVAGSLVTIAAFVTICCHLYALSTERRVKAIRQLINAERHIRDYYFSQIVSTRIQSEAVRLSATGEPNNVTIRSRPARRYEPNSARNNRPFLNVPSSYGPDLAVGSGVYDLRRQLSGFYV